MMDHAIEICKDGHADQGGQPGQAAATLAVKLSEQGIPCSEAAFRAIAKTLNLDIPEELIAASTIFHHGAATGDRCGIFESGVLLIGFRYGRLEPNLEYQADRYLAEKLFDKFQETYGSYFCRDIDDGTAPCVLKTAVPWITEILRGGEELMKDAPTGPKWIIPEQQTSVETNAVIAPEAAKKITPSEKDRLKEFFFVHKTLWDFTDAIVSEEDWTLIASAGKDRRVDIEKYGVEYLIKKYRQGFLMKDPSGETTDEAANYIVGGFASRIDCCMRGERAFWDALPEAARKAYIGYLQDIEIWAVPYYLEGHTDDVISVIPFEEAEKVIRAVPEGYVFSVKECDCRIYNDLTCDYPLETCLHWKEPDEINTSLDRGYARAISRDEAVEVLRTAYKGGLVHSYGEFLGGFCNCCNCCCWAFKGMDKLRALGYNPREIWYRADYVIDLDAEKCVNCGLCVKKCQFSALAKGAHHIEIDTEKCWGCGACRPACTKEALRIIRR